MSFDSSPTSIESEYRLLRDSAGVSTRGAGFLALQGGESLDFLNRLSTNDLAKLPTGKVRPTILTTEKGRMIDLVLVLNAGDHIVLVVSEGNSAGVKGWLEKFLIMENISITDLTPFRKRISILGPEAPSIASHLAGTDVTASGDSFFRLPGAAELFLYRNPEWSVPVYDIVGEPGSIDPMNQGLRTAAGEKVAAPGVGQEAIEVFRVETGIPLWGREITDQVNPLEAGLSRFVSFTKGCYIGQEVIARLDTYKKLQRNLRGFIFPEGYEDRTPGRILSGGAEVGWTTSHVLSLQAGRQVALGYLKVFPELDVVSFKPGPATGELSLQVVDLPFIHAASGPVPSE